MRRCGLPAEVQHINPAAMRAMKLRSRTGFERSPVLGASNGPRRRTLSLLLIFTDYCEQLFPGHGDYFLGLCGETTGTLRTGGWVGVMGFPGVRFGPNAPELAIR
jgi:hypothetical protein